MHSEYSVTDSTVRLDAAIHKVKDQGVGALGLTDLNNIFGGLIFYTHARKAGVKPILGCDLVIQNEADRDKPYRLAIFCQNKTGYHTLCELLSRAWLKNQYMGRGETKLQWLLDHNEGLIVLSGGYEGQLAQLCLAGKTAEALALAQKMKDVLGDRFFLELQRAGRPSDEAVVRYFVALAQKADIPVVATQPIQFLEKADFDAHDLRVCIARGDVLADKNRPKIYSPEQYLKSPEEMISLFADVPSAIANTVEIAKRCNLEGVLSKPQLPLFPTPDGMSLDDYIDQLAHEGLEARLEFLYPKKEERDAQRPRYVERLEFELDIIKRMGFPGYFLIVQDFINWSKNNGVAVGPGRGSGAGSLVAYSLRITDMDPLRYDLLFERFLNPERVSMPDFDVDFCQYNRQRTINYVKSRYGEDAVSQIATFGTMGAKGVIRDVGRVLGISYSLCDKVSRLIPAQPGKSVSLQEAVNTVPDLKALIEKDETVAQLIEKALPLEGLVRNLGMHAGGVLIAPGKLTDFCPLYSQDENPDNVISQFDKKDVENVGLVKFDFLGLTTLTILEFAMRFIRQLDPKSTLKLDAIPIDDVQTYELFQTGNTAAVFQFESPGMQKLLKDARPDCLEDLIALNALYRPGPMDLIPEYIACKHGEKEVHYDDPRLEPVLKETYGIMVYQEQVMRVAQIIGGYSLGGADLLRRAMGKKQVEEMKRQRVVFVKGALERGMPEDKAGELFDKMEKFAGYGFNKSHACAYAYVAYQTAYLKRHYPAPFMAANMCLVMDSGEKLKHLIDDCFANGISVLPPDINQSEWEFTPTSMNQIRYGLGGIKGIPKESAEAIVKEREANGPFKDLFDLVSRVDRSNFSKRTLLSFVMAGVFDSIEPNRAKLAANIDGALALSESEFANAGQESLFADIQEEVMPEYKDAKPWSPYKVLTGERDVMGCVFSGHFFGAFQDEAMKEKPTPIVNLRPGQKVPNRRGANVLVAGIASNIKSGFSKEGKPTGSFLLDDGTGVVSVNFFGDDWLLYRNFVKSDELIFVKGNPREDKFSPTQIGIWGRKVEVPATIRAAKGVVVQIEITDPNFDMDVLKTVLQDHRPDVDDAGCRVAVKVTNGQEEALFTFSHEWDVYVNQQFLDDLEDVQGISYELMTRR
ncbi:MAG TPA: DNA polymerase III subunit alpha [Candidatus Aphodousia gallistercoris]|nr:DNA polymerase III subunit alpha [Candidatus Aphodousia gallistercoris]